MKILRRIIILIFSTGICLGLALQVFWVQVDPNNAATVIAAVQQRGAGWVVADAVKEDTVWDQILDNIATGKSEWIEAYKVLVPAIEAESAAELITALSQALLKNPEAVLAAVSVEGSPLALEKVCGALSEDELEYLDEGIAALKAQMKGVSTITKPELSLAKERCLGQIQQVLAREIFR